MSSPKKRILVVDDTEATRYAIARTLKSSGYDVLEAANGKSALELVLSEQPDLVTLDIHLPDIIGFEVCRQIKAHPRTTHIPVLQVSASFITVKDRIHGLEGGADSYLTHPFEPPVLLATVKALLRTREITEDLRTTEERFRVALKNSPIMTYTTDLDLRYTWIYNPPNGLTAEYFLNKLDSEIFADARALIDLKTEVLRSGKSVRRTLTLTFGEHENIYDLTIEPFIQSGQLAGLTVAGIDVSERVRSSVALTQAKADAELANQAKSRFLSNMSHEIRTPLGIIQGFADLVMEDGLPTAERDRFLTTIKRNAHNLTQLLGDILDLAKVEAGKIDVEKNRFSVRELLRELLETLNLSATEKGLSLRLELADDFPDEIESDPTRLRQILMNLIGNSLKFTERGQIVIRGWSETKDCQTRLLLEVRDSGIGLDLEQQARLFQPFAQADSTTTRKFGGSGLGLNLSRKLAQALGGDLVLSESSLGAGSRFVVDLPVKVFATGSKPREPKSKLTKFTDKLRNMRVLLVEDSEDNRFLFSTYLRAAGASVQCANDGVEALEQAGLEHYEAILMDVQMPNLDGYGATRQLRDRGDVTPIVALTANAFNADREHAMRSGFSDYLTKPLDPKLLISTLERFHTQI